MAGRWYIDFPHNGQRVHVKKLADVIPYAEMFETDTFEAYKYKWKTGWTPRVKYVIVDGKVKRAKEEV